MTTNPNGFMVVQNSTDESQLLGKFLYYSLADVLVQKEDFERICTALDFPYAGRRISVVDAFKNATGKVTRRTVAGASGSQEILRIYCRDNMRDGNLYSRELVRETVGLRTNRYDKLANICYDRDTDRMYHDVVENDPSLDVEQICRSMEEKFQVFRNCLGRSQIDRSCCTISARWTPCRSRFTASCTLSRGIRCTRLTCSKISSKSSIAPTKTTRRWS